jgi:hypothetical protein
MTDVRSIITIENHEVISFERGDSSIPELTGSGRAFLFAHQRSGIGIDDR